MNPLKDVVNQKAHQEVLPFTVAIAGENELQDVAALRASTYGKHLPQIAGALLTPERYDYDFGCEVFVARAKLDGSVLGTLRTHANALKPIPLQNSIQLPDHYAGARMVEATRLCVKGGSNASLVRSALFKALFQYCEMQGVQWLMAAGRRPVDRIYDSLMFTDVAEPGAFYPMAHAGHIPHRVMGLPVSGARALWSACQHPLYQFVIETSHPDICLDKALQYDFAWSCPEGMASYSDDIRASFPYLQALSHTTSLASNPGLA